MVRPPLVRPKVSLSSTSRKSGQKKSVGVSLCRTIAKSPVKLRYPVLCAQDGSIDTVYGTTNCGMPVVMDTTLHSPHTDTQMTASNCVADVLAQQAATTGGSTW
jgi:hypothetical protein